MEASIVSIPLPEGAQTEQAHAEFKDGVLEVYVPVPAAQQRGRAFPLKRGPRGSVRSQAPRVLARLKYPRQDSGT